MDNLGLIQLFADLGVETAKSDMSFSVQVPKKMVFWNGVVLAWARCLRNTATCSTLGFGACCAI